MTHIPTSPETESETHAGIVSRLEMNWQRHGATIGEALMRLIACQDSGSDVNLSGIDRDLIVYAMAHSFCHAQTPAERENIVRTINGIMVSHQGYTSPMLVKRIADAVLALLSRDSEGK